jgi:pyruvate kinase
VAPRRAKIVCTLGPASDSESQIRALIEAGMDVARLNFSHGSHAEHGLLAERVRSASRGIGRPVALLQDLSGPKIRTGSVGPAALATGETVELVSGTSGGEHVLSVDYPTIVRDVLVGDRILLADGQIELRVTALRSDSVVCRVEHGGALRPRMGVNLPAARLRSEALTDKDRRDLEYGLGIDVDYLALSFVRSAADIEKLRALCEELGRPTPIVAKIETPQAVAELEAIVRRADAIMVARGDLGVELPPEQVPVIQRQIVEQCRMLRKPVIVATEMLHSMMHSPRPTRAEASDVAGAVFGGADALMLSGETASGEYPLEACQMMDRIVREAERSRFYEPVPAPSGPETPEALAHAACELADAMQASLIVTLTQGGGTARLVSKARPKGPIIGFSPDQKTLRRLALYWGVDPRPLDVVTEIESLTRNVQGFLMQARLLKTGDRYVMVYGAPLGQRGSTNALRVERVE